MITIYTNVKDEDGDLIKFMVDDAKYHWGTDEDGIWFYRPQPIDSHQTEKIVVPWTSIAYMVER